MDRVNIKALSAPQLKAFMAEMGMPSYRLGQLIHWIYERRVRDFESMTEFSKSMRQMLQQRAEFVYPELIRTESSTDGTKKLLIELSDTERIESVIIPGASGRTTLCVSTQAGCAMGCRFCLTARSGLRRNLLAYEIVDQVLLAQDMLAPAPLTNLVFMGMGEPLMNFPEVAEAIRRLTEHVGFSARRITVSTSGVVDGMYALGQLDPQPNLAVSLNATTDELRSEIMPINRKYPLSALMEACRRYPLANRRRITFEYVMLGGVNDTPQDARRLVRLMHGIPSKINLIPFNPFEGANYERPDDDVVLAFQQRLNDSGITAPLRKSMGRDISAACGQLRGSTQK